MLAPGEEPDARRGMVGFVTLRPIELGAAAPYDDMVAAWPPASPG